MRPDCHVYPGFIDAHCHIGLDGYGIGYEGQDYNELNDPVTPQVQAIDGINPFDPCMKMAAKGRCYLLRNRSRQLQLRLAEPSLLSNRLATRVDNMIVKFPIAMKCAFGENPKRCYQNQGISSRMTNAAMIRERVKPSEGLQGKDRGSR